MSDKRYKVLITLEDSGDNSVSARMDFTPDLDMKGEVTPAVSCAMQMMQIFKAQADEE